MHLNLHNTAALTGFTAPALDVKAESSGTVTALLGILRVGKQRANIPEHPCVGGWIGPRRAPDWRLINADNFIDPFHAADFLALAGTAPCTVESCGQRFIKDLIDQC